jgi:hypothetical protein
MSVPDLRIWTLAAGVISLVLLAATVVFAVTGSHYIDLTAMLLAGVVLTSATGFVLDARRHLRANPDQH